MVIHEIHKFFLRDCLYVAKSPRVPCHANHQMINILQKWETRFSIKVSDCRQTINWLGPAYWIIHIFKCCCFALLQKKKERKNAETKTKRAIGTHVCDRTHAKYTPSTTPHHIIQAFLTCTFGVFGFTTRISYTHVAHSAPYGHSPFAGHKNCHKTIQGRPDTVVVVCNA